MAHEPLSVFSAVSAGAGMRAEEESYICHELNSVFMGPHQLGKFCDSVNQLELLFSPLPSQT